MAVIYGLFEQRKPLLLWEVRYIGQTDRTTRRRIYEHIRDSVVRHYTNSVNDWIRELVNKGVQPIIWELEQVVGDDWEERLDQREIAWIAEGRRQGWQLLNDTKGGRGWISRGPLSDEHRAKISIASRKAYDNDPSIRERISASLTSYYDNNPEAHEKLTEGKLRKYAEDPTYREKVALGGKKRFSDPAERQRVSEIGKAAWANNPERHEAARQRTMDPVARQQMSETLTALYEDPDLRRRIGDAVKDARSKEDKSPLFCDICNRGPFIGPFGLKLHKTKAHGNT